MEAVEDVDCSGMKDNCSGCGWVPLAVVDDLRDHIAVVNVCTTFVQIGQTAAEMLWQPC